MQKPVLIGILICLIALLAGITYLIISQGNSYDPKVYCTTPECLTSASALLDSMNQKVDPCNDFFQYACGGWIAKNKIPKSESRLIQMDIVMQQLSSKILKILNASNDPNDPKPVNQARDFYAACTDIKRLETVGLDYLTHFLSLFGGWPMTLSYWNESSFLWGEAAASGLAIYNLGIFHNIYNSVDKKNSSLNIIYIDQTNNLITPKSGTIADPWNSPKMAAYMEYITEAAKAIRNSLKSRASDRQIEQDVDDLRKFEFELSKIVTPDDLRRSGPRMYNPMTLDELQRWTDSFYTTKRHAKINWVKYVSDIYSIFESLDGITKHERVVVVEKDYIKKFVELLEITPLRTIANYVHWRFVSFLMGETTQEMKNFQFKFREATEGIGKPLDLPTSCAKAANDLFGYAISYKYIESNFDDRAKNEVDQLIEDIKVMIHNLKTAFKALVNEATWMDASTKAIAREKVDHMIENIGYPDWIKNKKKLENYYKEVKIDRYDHFGNLQKTKAFLNLLNYKNLRTPTDRHRWEMAPTVVDAQYNVEMNAVTFPAGILQFPLFGHGRLAALNYGGMGSVIGHEITHGFDDEGHQSDKFGNTANWWMGNTLKNYKDRAQCFIDQYNEYTVENGLQVNGVTTQGENIADNGGLREAFRAYQLFLKENNGAELKLPGLEQFSSEQIFFLQYANSWCGVELPERLEIQLLVDPHSPNRFRVIGPLSNNEDFVRLFHCPAGSPMNRRKKCILW